MRYYNVKIKSSYATGDNNENFKLIFLLMQVKNFILMIFKYYR